MAKRPVIIFDFGNVLVHFDFAKFGHALNSHTGLSGEAFIAKSRAMGLTPLLQSYESGGIDSKAFVASVCRTMELSLPHEEFAAAWNSIFWINEPVANLAAWLKEQGYTLVLGSNTNDLHATFYQREFATTLKPFDHLVLSHEVGHIKPSAAFYHACVKAAGVGASDCVFIDDLAENIEGAKAAGLGGIVYRDYSELLADLMRLGVDTTTAPRP